MKGNEAGGEPTFGKCTVDGRKGGKDRDAYTRKDTSFKKKERTQFFRELVAFDDTQKLLTCHVWGFVTSEWECPCS